MAFVFPSFYRYRRPRAGEKQHHGNPEKGAERPGRENRGIPQSRRQKTRYRTGCRIGHVLKRGISANRRATHLNRHPFDHFHPECREHERTAATGHHRPRQCHPWPRRRPDNHQSDRLDEQRNHRHPDSADLVRQMPEQHTYSHERRAET